MVILLARPTQYYDLTSLFVMLAAGPLRRLQHPSVYADRHSEQVGPVCGAAGRKDRVSAVGITCSCLFAVTMESSYYLVLPYKGACCRFNVPLLATTSFSMRLLSWFKQAVGFWNWHCKTAGSSGALTPSLHRSRVKIQFKFKVQIQIQIQAGSPPCRGTCSWTSTGSSVSRWRPRRTT